MGRIIQMRWRDGKRGAFTTSYDDGRMEDFRLAALMRQNGIKGTFNVNTGLFWAEDKPDPAENPLHRRMRRSEFLRFAREYRDVAEIAVHGVTHPDLSTLSAGQVVREVIDDRAALERDLGVICRGMAYPYGRTSDTAVSAIAACGIAYSRTIRATMSFDLPEDWLRLCPTCHHTAPELFDLLAAFREEAANVKGKPLLFYLWGHAYEFDDNDDWDRIGEFLQKAGGDPNVWYATNIEIADYVKAYQSLIWSADGTLVTNPTATPLWFRDVRKVIGNEKKDYRVDPGETVEVRLP